MDFEKIILGLIAYLKKFGLTMAWILFRPLRTARDLKEGNSAKYVNSTVFLCVSLFLFITEELFFVHAGKSGAYASRNLPFLFTDYGKELGAYSFFQKALMVVAPFLIMRGMFALIVIVFKIKEDVAALRSFCEFWVAELVFLNELLLFGYIAFLYFAMILNPLMPGMYDVYASMHYHDYFYAAIVIFLYVIPIAILLAAFSRFFFRGWKKFLPMAVTITCIIFFTPLMERIDKPMLSFVEGQPEQVIMFSNPGIPVETEFQLLKKDSSRYSVSFELMFRNQSERKVIFFKNNGISLRALLGDSLDQIARREFLRLLDSKGYQFYDAQKKLLKAPNDIEFRATLLDGEEKKFMVLGPGEIKTVRYENEMDSASVHSYFWGNEFDKYLVHAYAHPVNTDQSQADFHLNDPLDMVGVLEFSPFFVRKVKPIE